MTFRFREDRRRKRRTFLRYLFGGDKSPAAGDGYGLVTTPSPVVFRPVIYEPPIPTLEMNGSNPRETRQSPIPVSPKAMSPPPEVSQPPTPIFAAEKCPTFEAFECSPTEAVHSPRLSRTLKQPLFGCRAPASSPMTDVRSPTVAPLSPTESQSSSPSTPKPEPIEPIPWEDYEVPDELGIIREGMPQEIRNIVLDSMNERRILRASRLHQKAIASQMRIEQLAKNPQTDGKHMRENSTNTSVYTSPSEYRGSESTQSMSSATTVGSETTTIAGSEIGDGLLRRPSLKFPSGHSFNSKSANLSPQMAQVEFLLQQSKVRTAQSRKLFKILPSSRKSLGRPNTPEASHVAQNPTNSECTSCFEDVPTGTAVTGLSCNHKYCPLCFTQLILTCIKSESTFPPKCCLLEIPTAIIRSHLSPPDNAVYDQKALEYAIPIADRYYCPRTSCACWIDTRLAKRVNGGLACPHCRHKICLVCRGPSHSSNEDCPQDYGLSSALEQAEQAGWQRCFQCRTLVERNQGGRHITCNCGGEFCYTCGQQWGTCSCTDADQVRQDQEWATLVEQREADARREEDEVRAAIAAVERAEQHLAEERAVEERRAAEEAAELVRCEEERVVRVEHHFEYQRQVLEMVRAAQRTAIATRHTASQEMMVQLKYRHARIVAAKQREIRDEEEFLIIEGKRMIEILQRKHAHAMIETISRHRAHQDALRGLDLSHRVSRNPYQVTRQSDALKGVMLEALLPTQELERAELKAQQAREIKKWKSRTERALREHDAENACTQARRREKEKVRRMLDEGKKREKGDWMWFESLFEERAGMLREDKARFLRSGADAPPPSTAAVAEPLTEVQNSSESGSMPAEEEEGKGAESIIEKGTEPPLLEDGNLSEYVRTRGWTGTPNFGLGMRMDSGREVAAVGG